MIITMRFCQYKSMNVIVLGKSFLEALAASNLWCFFAASVRWTQSPSKEIGRANENIPIRCKLNEHFVPLLLEFVSAFVFGSGKVNPHPTRYSIPGFLNRLVR